jgi:hypothetical protein
MRSGRAHPSPRLPDVGHPDQRRHCLPTAATSWGICSTVHRDQFAAALVSAVLFGATFLGVGSLALALGAHLQFPRAVALLTTG